MAASPTVSRASVLAGIAATGADSPIKTGKDCNGKIVAGSALADFNALVAMAWIDQNGGDGKSVKLVEIPQSALLAALHETRLEELQPAVDVAVRYGLIPKGFDAAELITTFN